MSLFSTEINNFWQASFLNGEVLCRKDNLTVAINPALSEDRRAMLLETADGQINAVLTPALIDKLKLNRDQNLSEQALRQKLREGYVELHGADYVFYFSEAAKQILLEEAPLHTIRQLSAADEAVFAEFQSSASEQDLDDAYVELDHWAVFGAFENKRLVCAASMYPWEGQKIADLGVLTLPLFRGRSYASNVVRAISRYACNLGYEPQYRCQIDNHASTALAKKAGLAQFGKWEVISPDSTE
ncbi:GNAT family N-acetyltransferase [Chitinimonas sp. PSY-7]|uniref:GNAT family N-acetyltransferase n=1 Tax=Chitinimonas sp. PSY-7 TaxID=3459088 RepID=UPI0040403F1F